MGRLSRLFAGFALLVALALCSGCAATYQPMGSMTQAPAMTTDGIATPDGVTLPLRVWPPDSGAAPKAVVLALHGFNDYSNAFEGPGRFLAAHGIATYAYDQRGFGASERPGIWPTADTLIADLRTAAALVRQRHPGIPLYLLGESMGGAVVLSALAEPPPGFEPLDPAGTILSAPAVWDRDSLTTLQRAALWISYRTVPWLRLTAPRELRIQPSDNIEMLRALSRDPLVIKGTRVDAVEGLVRLMSRGAAAVPSLPSPALVLYGRNEQVLPRPPIVKTLAALPRQTKVAIYENGYHMLMRDLEAATVLDDIAHWIADPAAPLPSGADRLPFTEAKELVASDRVDEHPASF
ncbi:lysophospholipase [Skermanella stibiiresistens SB22]|uniref:Lysophospholipase n=1 Tax=Skermanella stibiiresistens SB22 TaxID=1385369 RepID=W9H6Y4_9PROT|nr:alpha/beta hydrolase [Skermanella stibiiresistens]EWY40457.1 lysophospholipase [Skermanella stibiiresistens SB22]